MIVRARTLVALVLSLGGALGACGRTQEGGEGSETHWLSACASSSDCDVGECVCGVCTRSCATVRECPSELDACLPGGSAGEACGETICQRSSDGPGLSPASDVPVARRDACEDSRPLGMVRTEDQRFDGELAYESQVATDGSDGFLLFGQSLPGVVRVSPAGDFVRLLPPPPFERPPMLDHIIALDDGSVLLAGTVGEPQVQRAWIGKLDANWTPVWESQLELDSVERVDLVALPGGEAALVGVRWLDRGAEGVGGDDDLMLARFDADGQLVWEWRGSFENAQSFSQQRGFHMLARTAQGLQVVLPTDGGVYRVTSDLDGNVEPASVAAPLAVDLVVGRPQSIGLEALSDESFALFSLRRVVVLNAAGEQLWRFDSDESDYIAAVRFDAARAELVIAGQYIDASRADLPGLWVKALRLDGELSWEVRKPGLDFGEQGQLEATAESAPPLLDAAIDAKGNMIMTGQVGRGLEWVWVGGESCGG